MRATMRAKRLVGVVALAAALFVGCLPAPAFADDALGDVDQPNAAAAQAAGRGSAAASGEGAEGAEGGAAAGVGSGGAGGAGSAATASGAASEAEGSGASVEVSREGQAALADGESFAIGDFTRAQKGSNRAIDGTYHGYGYLIGHDAGSFVQVVATSDYVVCYIPARAAGTLGLSADDPKVQQAVKRYFIALDERQAQGSAPLSSMTTWHFTSSASYDVGAVRFLFDQQPGNGNVYSFVIGVDGSDLTDSDNPNYLKPVFADYGRLVAPDAVDIVAAPTGLVAASEFLSTLDWSPLWVSLRTTGIAIAIIFVLGLLAAYFCLNVSQRTKNIFDVLFTIPMVLPPTVCGFILLYLCGSNTAFGQFWIDTGFPLIFSPTACVIAAVVVAFPLMYRNALGAFESLDPNMLDAARTLGWSNAKIFVRLMLPLSWSSIAAGTVLAFARALGEFGATLFMAGNYVGITRTIPIAIYFEWMNGNDEVAWFWTAVIIAFSFVVILFINLWSARTTKYRKREAK